MRSSTARATLTAIAFALSASTSLAVARPLPPTAQHDGGRAAAAATRHYVPSIALSPIVRAFRPSRHAATRPSPLGQSNGMWVYTAQFYHDDLVVYQQSDLSLTFVEKLTSGVSEPQGTVATPGGWWYVANSGNADVLVYRTTHNGPVGPVNSLEDAGQVPANVDVNPSRKLVAVSNVSTLSGGSGSVSIYVNRAAVPSRTLTYGSDNLRGIGIALDHHGNCYWSFNDATSGGGSIVEFAGCNGNGTPVITGLSVAGGLTFDQHDNLYYVDQGAGSVYSCRGTTSCQTLATGFGDPVNINFELKDKVLWLADATGYIDALDPQTGAVLYTTPAVGGSGDPPLGIAPAPGAK